MTYTRHTSPALGDLPAAPPELDEAACAQVDSELFFPHPHATVQQGEAKSICRHCPVATACLTWSLQLHSALPYGLAGIWGGTTHAERATFLRNRAA